LTPASFISKFFERSKSRQVGAIGFELAFERLHMLQMERCGSNYLRIRAATSVPYLDRESLVNAPGEFKAFIQQALMSKPFQGRRIVTCLPADRLKLLSFTYRANPSQNEGAAVMKGVEERLGREWRDIVVDYIPIRKGDYERGERAALVAVARRESVIEYLEMLRAAGLTVAALEIGPLAIKRLLSTIGNGKTYDLVLAINFGRTKSYLTAVSGKRLLLDRELDFGEKQMVEKLQQDLELNANAATSLLYQHGFARRRPRVIQGQALADSSEIIEALNEILRPAFRTLAEEINKVSLYLASETHGDTPKRLYLLGSIARWSGADELLSQLLPMPVEVLNPFSTFLARSDAAVLGDLDPIAGMALATGLALRGMDQ
jgi:type IV pilus assembly protein PilM